MAETPSTKYRLEQPYRDALQALAKHFQREGRINHDSEANAIRVLTEDASERILKKKLERG